MSVNEPPGTFFQNHGTVTWPLCLQIATLFDKTENSIVHLPDGVGLFRHFEYEIENISFNPKGMDRKRSLFI